MPIMHTIELADVARRGLAIYDEKLTPLLEPVLNGRAIALHVDTGEYIIAETLAEARRQMRERYPNPDGKILSRTIGPEINEPLLHRTLAGRNSEA